MTVRLRVNNVATTLSAAVATADTTMAFTTPLPAEAVPVSGTSYLPIIVDAGTSNEEICWVTGPLVSGSYPVARGQEGTSTLSHYTGATVVHGPTVADFLDRTRHTATVTMSALQANTAASGTIPLAQGYRLYNIMTSVIARVEIYTTAALLAADTSRAVGTAPADGSGVMLDYVTTTTSQQDLSPIVTGYDNESPPSGSIPIRVTNDSAATADVAVTFTYVRTET